MVFFFAACANLLAFLVIGTVIGGMAFDGKRTATGFYLGSGADFLEVSELTYLYSLWHGISVVVTLPIAIVLFLVFLKRD